MLQDMSNAGGVHRYRLEGGAEGVLGIIATDMDMPCPGSRMLQFIINGADFREFYHAMNLVTMNTAVRTQTVIAGIYDSAHNFTLFPIVRC